MPPQNHGPADVLLATDQASVYRHVQTMLGDAYGVRRCAPRQEGQSLAHWMMSAARTTEPTRQRRPRVPLVDRLLSWVNRAAHAMWSTLRRRPRVPLVDRLLSWVNRAARAIWPTRRRHARVLLVDRALFLDTGRGRFQPLDAVRRGLGRQCPRIALATLSPDEDRLDARDAGAEIVIPTNFTYDQFVRELDTAIRYARARARSHGRARWRGRFGGFVGGVLTALVFPILGELVLEWWKARALNHDADWNAVVVAGDCREQLRHGILNVRNVGHSPKAGIEITRLPPPELATLANLGVGQMLDRIDVGGTADVEFTVTFGERAASAAPPAEVIDELWIGLSGPGHRTGNPLMVPLRPLLTPGSRPAATEKADHPGGAGAG